MLAGKLVLCDVEAKMSIDLEQEFFLLMRTVHKRITDKYDAGELTSDEAEALTQMVKDRTSAFTESFSALPKDSTEAGWSISQTCY